MVTDANRPQERSRGAAFNKLIMSGTDFSWRPEIPSFIGIMQCL